MRILITGAGGFIGLNLLQHMAKAHPEAEIIGADLGSTLPKDCAGLNLAPDRLSFRRLDVTVANDCRQLMQDVKPTHIVHAAAVTFPDSKALSIEKSSSVNLAGTKHLLNAATSVGSMQQMLLLSSSGVYDHSSDASPCDENHALDLSTVYARTKRQAEMQMTQYEDTGGFPILAARIGPVYGEFEWVRTSRPMVSMVQKLVNCLLEKRPITIAGTEMHRDWTHADDVARALDLLLFAPSLNHRIYNVSSGLSVSSSSILDYFTERGLQARRVDDVESADMVLGPRQNRKALITDRLKQDTHFESYFDIRSGLAHVIAASQQKTRNNSA